MSDAPSTLVIMAGGRGTRFWPKSTEMRPKQLLSFEHGAPVLLDQTLRRFEGLVQNKDAWIVTTETLRNPIQETLLKFEGRILGEPQARNTAPCLYWAAQELAAVNPESVMIVMPADHAIANVEAFQNTLKKAIAWAKSHDDLVTLGVQPTHPETGYGYLKKGVALSEGAVKVERFVEKPNLENAKRFFDSGEYLWNGGMFVWKARVLLEAFDRAMPEYQEIWKRSKGRVEEAYPQLTATSIDFGVMERSENVVTFPLDCGWDDLGSWTSLESLARSKGVLREEGVINARSQYLIDTEGCIVDAPDRAVALLGVKDLIVVDTGDVLMVLPKAEAQRVKELVEAVKSAEPKLV